MNNLPFVFSGIFIALALSWTGLVLTSQIQLGDMAVMSENYALDEENMPLREVPKKGEPRYPGVPEGRARQGKAIFISLGCVYCHTQQVRREDFGTDLERGWGSRQSVARDYIRQDRVLLGESRIGPDLANVGDRLKSKSALHQYLFNPRNMKLDSAMPAYSFLYEKRKIRAEGKSPEALDNPAGTGLEEGYELLPSRRAEALAAYLLSLKHPYQLPEVALNRKMEPDESDAP